jgi:hypothetical protein
MWVPMLVQQTILWQQDIEVFDNEVGHLGFHKFSILYGQQQKLVDVVRFIGQRMDYCQWLIEAQYEILMHFIISGSCNL